jgi:predicted  nucleic acid-binding Zn-ribbon protein
VTAPTGTPIPQQMKAMEHLQELDLKIDHLKKNKNALPEALKALDQAIAKVQTQANIKNAAIAEIDKTQKQTRAALDLNRDRLARSTSRLESVQNSQEYTAVNKELEQLKKLNLSLEEQSKKSDGEVVTIQKELTDINAQLEKSKNEREAQASLLSGQGSQLEKEIQILMDERSKYTGQVDKPLLSQYDRVRGARGGLGFVPALAGRCKGCNMMVPPQLYNEIRKAQVVHSCPSCHRILFVPEGSS